MCVKLSEPVVYSLGTCLRVFAQRPAVPPVKRACEGPKSARTPSEDMSLLKGSKRPSAVPNQQRIRVSSAASSSLPSAAGPSLAPASTPAAAALWVDKHAPRSSGDLAVHKKKVEEVRDWLKRADASLQLGLTPTPRMLVLSGPTGSGKSAMLQVLAQELQFEVCEWLEPRSEAFLPFQPGMEQSAPYESRMKQFATFLQSSLRTLSLCVGPSASNAAAAPSQGMRRRLVLLDELPNTAGGGERSAELARQLQVLLRRALLVARFPMVLPRADAYAPGPPLGTYGLRVPASRVGYVPEAQGGLPPGPHAQYVLGTRTSHGRTARTACCGTPGARAVHVTTLTLTLTLTLPLTRCSCCARGRTRAARCPSSWRACWGRTPRAASSPACKSTRWRTVSSARPSSRWPG